MSPAKSFAIGVWLLPACFLVATIPIEVAYSWRGGLANPYFLVKLVGWILLSAGAARVRKSQTGLAFLTAGWGWMAANFWRAVADRISQGLSFGSAEVWFTGGCLLLCVIGLAWSLRVAAKPA
jgi:hypothetical protein